MSDRPQVVVLGGTGYVGRAICDRLAMSTDRSVVSLGSQALNLTGSGSWPLLDDLVGPDTVLVFSSALTPDRGAQTVDGLKTNLVMAMNVARYLGQHAVGRLVYLSSDAVYGVDHQLIAVEGVDHQLVTEASPVAPLTYYAVAKYASERILQIAAATRVPVLVLRVTGVYGPGDPHDSYGPTRFARSVGLERSVTMIGKGEEYRDHVFIDDVARIVVALVDRKTTGVVNLATGVSRSFAGIIEDIRQLVPYQIGMVSTERTQPITHRHFDTARLRDALHDFTFTPFQEGLRATLKAFGALP